MAVASGPGPLLPALGVEPMRERVSSYFAFVLGLLAALVWLVTVILA